MYLRFTLLLLLSGTVTSKRISDIIFGRFMLCVIVGVDVPRQTHNVKIKSVFLSNLNTQKQFFPPQRNADSDQNKLLSCCFIPGEVQRIYQIMKTMLRNLSRCRFKAIQCMSGILSQYFCSRGHVSIVKTPVSQMGPCQVECRFFMLSHPPILTMERLVGGVYNEQSTSLSHAQSLFSQSCYREHCYSRVVILDRLYWKGVVMSCRASLEIVYRNTTETVEIQKRRPGGLCCPVLYLYFVFYPSCQGVYIMTLQ